MIKQSSPSLGKEEVKAVSDVILSSHIAHGKKVSEFEKRIAEYIGRKYAIVTSSGTTALKMALIAAGVKPGDRILSTVFSCKVIAHAILDLDCVPVFCDIDPETYNMSLESNYDFDALLMVHTFGFPCDIDSIKKRCRDKIIIEDFAQAIGSEYKGEKIGNFGSASITSFYATKLMTTGHGGALLTDSKDIKKKAEYLRYHEKHPSSYLLQHPKKIKGIPNTIPCNYMMTDIQAAIGLVQLAKLDAFIERRREICKMYDEGLAGTGLKLPTEKKYGKHIYYKYNLLCGSEKERNRLVKHLLKKNIEVGILWPEPLHLIPLCERFGYKSGDFPVAEDVSRRIVSIPMHPCLSNEEVNYIIKSIKGL